MSRILSLTKRLPSWQAFSRVLYVSVLLVQAWAFFNVFREIPALRYRESTWDLLGIVAIVQVAAFVESCVLALLMTIIAAVLPASVIRQKFVAQSTAFLAVSSAWAVAIHFQRQSMTAWGTSRQVLWLGLYGLTVLTAWFLVQRFDRVEHILDALAQRLAILAQVYIAISLLALVIVVIRNI